MRFLSQPAKSCADNRSRGTLAITERIGNNFMKFAILRYLNLLPSDRYLIFFKVIMKKIIPSDLHEISEAKGGKCLSEHYINAKTKLLWECAEGHQWEARPSNIKIGHWCPFCAGKARLTIEEMREIAAERGGKCLSDRYINGRTKLLWECAEGHQWEATPNVIKRKRWCPVCGTKRMIEAQRLSIEDMRETAKERGGKCLLDKYINVKTKLLWECIHGHQWKARPNDIRTGTWCPICSSGLGERICREYFEQLFEKKFPKSYPAWLINENGNRMELDGYCRSLNIAFEHHGEQHYTTETLFIKSEIKLKRRQADDELKKSLCEKKGVHLIEIPSIFYRISLSDLRTFIAMQCYIKDIPIPKTFHHKTVNLKKAYITSRFTEELRILQSLAISHRGQLLSSCYVNSHTKLSWKCKKGHEWKATPNHIKGGKWCPFCAGHIKLTLQELERIAEKKDGRCLSKEYVNARKKVLWECAKGHQWEATADNVKRGHWCPFCAGKARLTIEEMREIAAERGGKCLSDRYINGRTKLLWECAEGHQWEAIPSNTKKGHWCPICANKKGKRI